MKISLVVSQICPGQIWSNWAFYLAPKGPIYYTRLKAVPASELKKKQLSYWSSGNLLQNIWKTDFWPNFGTIWGQKEPENIASRGHTLHPGLYTHLKVSDIAVNQVSWSHNKKRKKKEKMGKNLQTFQIWIYIWSLNLNLKNQYCCAWWNQISENWIKCEGAYSFSGIW